MPLDQIQSKLVTIHQQTTKRQSLNIDTITTLLETAMTVVGLCSQFNPASEILRTAKQNPILARVRIRQVMRQTGRIDKDIVDTLIEAARQEDTSVQEIEELADEYQSFQL